MNVISRQFNRAVRVIALLSVCAASPFTSQTVIAQPIVIQSNSALANSALSTTAQIEQSYPASQDVLDRLGIQRPQTSDLTLTELSLQIADQVRANGLPPNAMAPQSPNVGGMPENLSGLGAQAAMLMTTLNSHPTSNFRDVMLMADVDGREDLTADHARQLTDLSPASLPAGWMLTRAAMSAHTHANGFTNTVYYYGDSVGNVYVGVDTTGNGQVVTYTVLNLPTILNAFGTLNSDDQIVVTGLATNPVADLSSFPNVNGSFTPFRDKIGEILYVTFWDTGGGFRLTANNQVVQSGVLAFPIADEISPAYAPPGVQSQADFPIMVGGSFGVAFSVFANLAGVTVDDDGSIYFQQVDLARQTGANIVKIASTDKPGLGGFQDRSLATNGYATLTSLSPVNGNYGTISGPANQVGRITNYSGNSLTFGNITTLAAGPRNILYAGLARSYVATDTSDIQNTEGLFTNPPALGATPSMIISFADVIGAWDTCTAPISTTVGSLPVADGIADVAQTGLSMQAGVNNFRAFALGTGPDVRGSLIGATISNTLQLDFQVDQTVYSGLAVDEESKVYLISGGTPAGIGRNPSPNRGEILALPDQQRFDRRADAIDLRGDVLPIPPASSGNVGNGITNRFDYVYYAAALDPISVTPIGLSGLARGFLLYLNRTRDVAFIPNLPNGTLQGDDDIAGPLNFEDFDPGHQIAGGDDQNSPFRGDDDDGAGSPTLAGALKGGFEFTYREYVSPTLVSTAWNAFYLNSNGNLTFGAGDTDNTPSESEFLSGLPRIAGAWADLNPSSRLVYTNTFPVQALGFANINHFVVRWINVPTFSYEGCNSSNTFSISLYDDGTSIDENANQPLNPANPIGNNAVPFDLQEGPTDLRFYTDTNSILVGSPARLSGSGNACLTYGRMDLLGSEQAGDPVGVGVTPGLQPLTATNAINVSAAALVGDVPFPLSLGIGTGGVISASTYEVFTLGVQSSYTVTGGITTTFPAEPVFDLRQEGNDPISSTIATQPDFNRDQVCFHNLEWQGIVFGLLPNVLTTSMPITVAATATSGLPVSFSASGKCASSGPAGSVIGATGIGTCFVTAYQSGNSIYAPAANVQRTFKILTPVYLPLVMK